MIIYNAADIIPLSFQQIRNGTPVSGLSVSVVVKNASNGATLLASTLLPESAAGSGMYNYNWSHGIQSQTVCNAIYTISGKQFTEIFLITNLDGGHTA